jgi:predicted NBD/HSP70 family sugar kinase
VIGLEVLENGAVAVALADDGRVVARADVKGADAASAALSALDQVSSRADLTVAVACPAPQSAWCTGGLSALTGRSATVSRPVASGIAAAAAEAWVGAAIGAQDVVFLGVTDHTSAGILRGGQPLTGADCAPAIAWLSLNPVERDDYRRVGCLEAEVAAAGIVRRLIWRVKAGDHSKVEDAAGGDLSAITLDHVMAAARDGDGVSISVMRDTAKYLGMAAANLAAVAHPEVLVLGGLMASASDLLLESIRTEIGRRLPAQMVHALKIVPATLGVDGPAIGAVRFASADSR